MKRFSTFEEVVEERKSLQADLVRQKLYIRTEMMEIRDKLAPVQKALSFFARFGHRDNSTAGNLLKMGTSVGIDLLVGQKMKKAGWLARLVLPLVMKFTASRSIDAVRR